MIKLKSIIETFDNRLPISKKEEDYALHYVNRTVIPDLIDDYNQLLKRHPNSSPTEYPQIGSDTIRKNLRKISRESIGITYLAKITNSVSFRFWITKQFEIAPEIIIKTEILFGSITRSEGWSVDIPISDTLLREHFALNRREEDEGLQFIRRYLIPEFVKHWNDRTVYHITEKQLANALRKVDERRPPQYINVHSNDSIYYTATVPVESYNFPEGLKIKFTLTKDGDGMLIVGFESPLVSGEWYYVRPPYRRINEAGDGRTVNKMDEEYALQMIRTKLIPQVVGYYNDHYETPISADLVRKNLKKEKIIQKKSTSTALSDIIVFTSKLSKDLHFTFTAQRSAEHRGRLMIHCQEPIGCISGMYLQESISDRSMSKEEEEHTFQYLKRVIIPHAVKHWNRAVQKSQLKGKESYILTDTDLSRTIRKTGHHLHAKDDRTTTDVIQYEAPVVKFQVKEPFKFETYKQVTHNSLMASMKLPGSVDWTTYIVGQSLDENLQEWTGDTFPISKKEEDWAVHKIKEIWGRVYGPHFNRTLRKFGYDKTTKEISYWSEREDGLEFLLIIRKNHDGLHIAKFLKTYDKWVRTSEWILIMETKPEQKLTEADDDDYRLSKEDEQNAVTYLLRRLLPQILKEKYTQYLDKHPGMYKPTKYPRITPHDVARRFRKIRFDVDSARYESIINDDVDFAFEIRKEITTQGPRLVIGAQGPLNVDWTWYPVKYDLQEARIKAKPAVIRQYPISKMEEEEALQFIRRVLIPQAVNDWNTMITPRPEYTAHEVSRSLRKVRREVPNKSTILAIIVYESKIRTTEFVFKIAKSADGKLVAGIGYEPQIWYDLYSNKIKLEEAFSPNDSNQYAVSKMEEEYALETIKRKLIPQIVDWVNEARKDYTGNKPADLIKAKRSLKKVDHVKQHPRLRDNITYQIKIEGEPHPFQFNIYKNSERKLIVNNVADGTSHFVKM